MPDRIYGSIDGVGRRSAFIVSLPEQSDAATAEALAIARAEFKRRPRSLMRAMGLECSTAYVRQLFTDHADLHMRRYRRLLSAISRESACASLQAFVRDLRLKVSLEADDVVKDVQTEGIEAAAAVGEVFQKLNAKAPADQIEIAVARAEDELSDIAQAVRS